MRLVVCVGTATEVGKTWMGAQVLGGLRAAGRSVAAAKPVQSFEPGTGPTDAEVLAAATGQDPYEVCPPEGWFEVPLAPPMAAARLGRALPDTAAIVAGLGWPDGCELGWVETVGGPRSPLSADGDGVDLVEALDPHLVVLVADAGLGVINAVRLAAAPFAGRVLVALNRFDARDPLHVENAAWLSDRCGFHVATSAERLIAWATETFWGGCAK